MKYHLISLGCQMNKSDGERISTVIEQMGYQWTDHEEEANLLGILACSVRQKSIDKVYSKIQKWNKSKDHRNLVTFISGCILPRDKEQFLTLFDILFHINELVEFPEMLRQYGVVTPLNYTFRVSHLNSGKDRSTGALFYQKEPESLKSNGFSMNKTVKNRLENTSERHKQRIDPFTDSMEKGPKESHTQKTHEQEGEKTERNSVDGEAHNGEEKNAERNTSVGKAFKQEGEKTESNNTDGEVHKRLEDNTEKSNTVGKNAKQTVDHAAQPYDPSSIKRFWHIQPHYASEFEAFIPIQNGCDKFCTFCAVPYTRGREVSRPSTEIIDELKSLVEKDYKSITLLGQNVNSYGLDKNSREISFAQLLEEIGKYGEQSGKKFWVYFTSPHPRDMEDDIIDVMARYDCLAKQVHLPVQSGDNKVLMRMNRKHNIEKYRKIVQKIRNTIPEATLFTDIIVGFTGETGAEFENTRKIMEEFKYNMAYIAKYSPRPGATSSRWADDVPHETKKGRLEILTNELKKHSAAYNQRLVGTSIPVLVTGNNRKGGYLSGLTEGKINVRFPSWNLSLIGQFVHIEITAASDLSIEGELETVKEEKGVVV